MTDKANPLRQLGQRGQAVWLDYLRRDLFDGELKTLIDRDGLTGMTSNPSIFEKAIASGKYDADIVSAVAANKAIGDVELYEHMAIADIQKAADQLRVVYDKTGGKDGFISLEVSPKLANDTNGTIEEARRLWKTVGRDNLMVKVPGTKAGIPAIQQLTADGLNINITLLFSQDAYKATIEAYVAGLEARAAKGQPVDKIGSVASFFVSRIDSMVDDAIEKKIAAKDPKAGALSPLRGKFAIANAKLAYQHYLTVLASPRWKALAAKGAKVQRLLWASTGTKNKAYPDTLYIDELIGPDTVNTMPPATMDAFRDHGKVRESLLEDVAGAHKVFDGVSAGGIDLGPIMDHLVADGVKQFETAFDTLLGAVKSKRASKAA
ncbi:MAG TPA: transaldolase [Magnetospirillaceae bacterium]|jgi:transaldolase/glucose-6-phosphate isomerase